MRVWIFSPVPGNGWSGIFRLTLQKRKLRLKRKSFLFVFITFLFQCPKASHDFMNHSSSALRVNAAKHPRVPVAPKDDIPIWKATCYDYPLFWVNHLTNCKCLNTQDSEPKENNKVPEGFFQLIIWLWCWYVSSICRKHESPTGELYFKTKHRSNCRKVWNYPNLALHPSHAVSCVSEEENRVHHFPLWFDFQGTDQKLLPLYELFSVFYGTGELFCLVRSQISPDLFTFMWGPLPNCEFCPFVPGFLKSQCSQCLAQRSYTSKHKGLVTYCSTITVRLFLILKWMYMP